MDKEQIASIIDRLDDLHRCLDRHVIESTAWRETTDKRLDFMQKELTLNTEVTQSARGAYKVLQVIGGIAAAFGGVVILWQLIVGDKPSIGPMP